LVFDITTLACAYLKVKSLFLTKLLFIDDSIAFGGATFGHEDLTIFILKISICSKLDQYTYLEKHGSLPWH
jgi:hypothetical protein